MPDFYPSEEHGYIPADPFDCESCQLSPTGACRFHQPVPPLSEPIDWKSGYSGYDDFDEDEDW